MGLGATIDNVVGVTIRARAAGLPGSLVVVSDHDGDEWVCLNTSDMRNGECSVVVWDVAARKVSRPRADGFESFLESDVAAFL